MPPRKRLGQLLTELGVIDEHQLQSALGHQKQWGGKLGSVLVQKGFCKEPDVVSALSKHLGMPSVKLAEQKIDPRAVKFVSKQIAEKLHVFAFDVSGSGRGEVLTIAMSDPTDLSAVDQLAFHTGKRIKAVLAGDSEIVQAIHQHYGGEEKAAPLAPAAAAKPAAAPAPVAKPPAAAPAAAAFPKRIEPASFDSMPTPPGGSPRVAPYIPPPAPSAPGKAPQELEEIEPDEASLTASATPPPPPPEPLEIPEDDSGSSEGQMMGLEPIAAHSQFGDQVAGAEEVSGEGTAADAVEGLESASVPHEGVAPSEQMEGLEPVAAQAQEPAPEGGWEQAPSTSWEEAPRGGSAAAPTSEELGAAQDWSGQPAGEGEPSSGEASEELPMDAIIGTAEEAAAEQQFSEQPAAPAAEEQPAPGAEAEAPAAWASSEDPLAAQADAEQPAEAGWAAEEATPPTEAAAETAAESVTAEAEAPPEWAEAPAEEQPAAEAAPASEAEEPAAEAAPASEAEQPSEEQPPAGVEVPSEEFTEEQGEMKLEGWVAPPAEPEPQGAGWIGEALEATTPLSPNDVGTLSAVGVDPNDGVAALRALAAILRVLNRRQMLDVDEIANEIRESREQAAAAAAERAAQLANGTPAEGSAPSQESAPAQESVEPAET